MLFKNGPCFVMIPQFRRFRRLFLLIPIESGKSRFADFLMRPHDHPCRIVLLFRSGSFLCIYADNLYRPQRRR